MPIRCVAATDGRHDVVIYGATSAGIVAAIEADRLGKRVLLIEPSNRVGGLTTGGLGQTDIGSKEAIGGLSYEFYVRIARHYRDDESWTWQERAEYRDGGQTRTEAGEDAMWTFEPSVALSVFEAWLAETRVELLTSARLDRETGVLVEDGRIRSIRTEDGVVHGGSVFIDATYEGDLMAAAGVSYEVGRESNEVYGERYNGVQLERGMHQLVDGVDPFVVPGDPTSGLLPFVEPERVGEAGPGDHRVQAYNFRMCLTDHPENRIPFQKPADYDPLAYELLFRNFEAGSTTTPWLNSRMPNRKTDTNNHSGFSTDYIGANYSYPEASYQQRERIVGRHRTYQQGLMWTLANHPRVPERVRSTVAKWGTCKDEFVETGGWPGQLYVREARRMVSDYVQTEHDCFRVRIAEDSVGLGAYNLDSHNTSRFVDAAGNVKNEGGVQVAPRGPYAISYRSIVPSENECANLLTPVCLSASHIAFGSIRMEPVFMVLGQSAGAAAALAIDGGLAVQRVPYERLRARLLEGGQVLDIPASYHPVPGIEPSGLPGLIVDDSEAHLRGSWVFTGAAAPHVGVGSVHDQGGGKGSRWATFSARVPKPGRYEVRLAYAHGPDHSPEVPVTIRHRDGESIVYVNQQVAAPIPPCWVSLGSYRFTDEQPAEVFITNRRTSGVVTLDAVQFVPR